jgi:two-component system sensor histidine kinase AlgZ
VLLDLGDLFRAALSEPGWVPLEHELDLCRRYLAIEQQRFGDRLRVEWRIEEGLEGLSVPLLTIQPLVENAVVHGLDERSGAKSLCVEAGRSATELLVSVRNAVPRDPETTARNGHSIGLAGVRARIESVTHGAGNLTTESDGTSFVARIVLPKAAMPARDQTTTR